MTSQPPAAAAAIFGSRLPLALAYHDSLVSAGPVRGLNGPREVPVLWERHLINSALLARLPGTVIPPGASVCDLGSGAGLPGIPLAIARPDLQVTLVDPLQRRITYLHEVVEELGLSNVQIIRARSGESDSVRVIGQHDVVTSRAVAPLGKLITWSAPHLTPDGHLAALKGRRAEEEIDTLTPRERGQVRGLEVVTVRVDDESARVVVARAAKRKA